MRIRPLNFTGCLAFALCLTSVAGGQTGGFAAGSRELFAIDFSKTPVGEFPKEIRLIKGKAQVVEKDGAHMLRATEPTDLLVNLSESLPDAFTLEFDLIPKACCNPSDLMFEGTPAMSRSASSSNIEWHPQTIIVVGGGEYFQMPMPQELAGGAKMRTGREIGAEGLFKISADLKTYDLMAGLNASDVKETTQTRFDMTSCKDKKAYTKNTSDSRMGQYAFTIDLKALPLPSTVGPVTGSKKMPLTLGGHQMDATVSWTIAPIRRCARR